MGLLDGLFGGGGTEDDPYADILTPAQRRQMTTQGLLAMAGAFADAGMPSRLPIPFGAALGKAAAALGTGTEAGMTAALAGAYKAQQIRDLRAKAGLQAQLFGPEAQRKFDEMLKAFTAPGAAPVIPGGGVSPPAGTYVGPRAGAAPAAADAPIMMDLPYPAAGGGLLGGGDTDLTGGLPGDALAGQSGVDTDLLTGGGLLASAPAAAPSTPPTNKQAWGVATPEEREAYIKSRQAGGQDTIQAFVMKYRLRSRTTDGSGGGLLGDGSGGGSGAADLGAGGDDATPVWNPTFPQTASRGGPASGDPLDIIAHYESGNRNIMQQVLGPQGGYNPSVGRVTGPSSAGGPWMMIDPTWRDAARKTGVDTEKYPTAISAPVEVQRAVAQTLYNEQGYAPWAPYNRQLAQAVGYTGGRGATTEGSGGSTEPDPYASWAGPSISGQPPAAPAAVPGMPAIPVPPGGDPAKMNALLLELARRNAAAEALGMGNPYGSMLSVLQGSPQYKSAVEAATETARRSVGLPFVEPEAAAKAAGEEPSKMRIDAAKAVLDQINKEAEQKGAAALKPAEIIVKDPQGGVMKIQGTEYQKALIANGFSVPELNVVGMYGPPPSRPNIPGLSSPGTPPPTLTPAGPGATGGLTPAGEPYKSPSELKLEESDIKVLEQKRAIADTARTTIQNANDLRAAIEQGVIAGAGADTRTQMLKLGQLLGITGENSNALIANTERYIASQGKNLKEGLAGLGPPISNNDTQIAERIAGGQMTTPQGMLEILRIREKYHRQAIVDYNRMASGLPASKIIGERTINEPPTYGAPTASGPNGQRVWQKPDGSWVPF